MSHIFHSNFSAFLHCVHDFLFGSCSSPWIRDLRHVYDDADHLCGLVTPVVGFLCSLFVPWWALSLLYPAKGHVPWNRGSRRFGLMALLPYFGMCIYELTTSHGMHDLIMGVDPRLKTLIQKCPTLLRGPKPPLWWTNRHVQFVPWILQNELHKVKSFAINFQRHEFSVSDCIDKSIPNCRLDDSMNDTITLDVYPPFNDDSVDFPASMPIIIFAPGLRCHSQDLPSTSIIRKVYGNGFRSIVVNRRGHTPDRVLTAPRWNLFGDVDDLEQAYWHIKNVMVEPNTAIFLHGISSGCAVVVSALAKWDKRALLEPDIPSPAFVASVLVTPGYDTSKVLQPDRFKWPYNPLMSSMVKEHFLMKNEQILRKFNNEAYEAAMDAVSLQDILNATAPFAGYPDAESYYRHTNPVNDLHYITSPVYVINSLDDPCCRIHNLYEKSQQPQHQGKSYAEMVAESQRGIVAVTKSGSHCPFLDGWFPFVKDPVTNNVMLNSWADQSILEFYEASLTVYPERRFM